MPLQKTLRKDRDRRKERQAEFDFMGSVLRETAKRHGIPEEPIRVPERVLLRPLIDFHLNESCSDFEISDVLSDTLEITSRSSDCIRHIRKNEKKILRTLQANGHDFNSIRTILATWK